MNTVPGLVKHDVQRALIDFEALTLRVQAVDDSLAYDGTEEHMDDLGGAEVGSDPALTGVDVVKIGTTASELRADPGPYLLAGIPALTIVQALVVFIDTGVPATSRIVTWLDRRADSTPLTFEATGATYGVTFPTGYITRTA